MSVFEIIALLLSIAALFSYINHRYIKLPTTIGIMLIALVISFGLIVASQFGIELEEKAEKIVGTIDFNQTLMHGMLSFLLFAGALHIDLRALANQKWAVGTFATVGIVVSSGLIAVASWFLLSWLGMPLPFIYCLIFGALISPTDPIAVLGLLKQAKAPKSLELKIAGESLFNDGVGVVLFVVLFEILTGAETFDPTHVVILFSQEVFGGIILGFVLGSVVFRMLKKIEDQQVEILLTLALVTGGYALAMAFHLSGPLTVVTAGLLIGNFGRAEAMSAETRQSLDIFWELIDEILNAVLFVLIGLELLILTLNGRYLLAGALMIPVVLLARFISIGIPVSLFRRRREFTPHAVKILTWGGLRGGISVALALSLPAGESRDLLLAVTYVIVVFSIVVQGLSLPALLRRTVPKTVEEEA